MRVALLTTFAASRKEPLVAMMDRVHQGFLDGGLGQPEIRFNFSDGSIASGVSAVDRVLKRHGELARFVTDDAPMPGFPGARRISNGSMWAGAGEAVPYSTLQAIAAGAPRSFPGLTRRVISNAPWAAGRTSKSRSSAAKTSFSLRRCSTR